MTVVVRMEDEHLAAIRRAIASLQTDAALLRWWGQHSVELTLAIDALHEIADRYYDQQRQHPDPWSRKVTT